MFFAKKWRKWSAAALTGMLLVTQWAAAATATQAPAEPTLQLVSEEPLTAGAVLKKYVWQSTRNGKAYKTNGNVIEVDLTNPYVKLDVMTGTENQFTRRQTVLGMATETKAVAGVNGDFYNTKAEGVPMGPQISDGKLMATPPYLPGFYSFALDKDNKPIVDLFTFTGTVQAADGATFPLGGINKTYYWSEPDLVHSHIDSIFMYTNAWGQVDRSNDGVTVPTEVLVQNNVITQIADNGIIKMIAPEDGYILRAAGTGADFVRQHLKVGDPLVVDYKVLPQDPSKTYDVDSFKMMIGGHTILVDGGQPAAFSREVASLCCTRARTAIGYNQDQTKVYLITVDHAGDSKGLTMTELQQFMIKVGVWKGLNLDGGGSTQMVARPLGEFTPQLINKPENGSQRRVVNGVGVYSTAPQGEVKALFIQAPSVLFLNEQSPLTVKGYDVFYNPIEMDKVNAQWSVADGMGTFKDNIFTPTKAGKARITAVSGQGTHSTDVEVIGGKDLESLRIEADSLALVEGQSYTLPVTATTKSGKTRQVPPEVLQWEVLGIEGEVKDGVLTVNQLNGTTPAQIIARYDGFSTMTAIPVAVDKVFYDLDNTAVMTMTDKKPDDVQVSVSIVPAEDGNKYLEMKYDFTESINRSETAPAEADDTGNKWAFATLDTNVLVEGEPQFMKLRIKGDESLNWLRAEIKDNAGTVHRVDLARNINWSGWKSFTVDLSEYKIQYPIRLQSIYVVNEKIKRDELSPSGTIGIDDIIFTYKGTLEQTSRNSVELTINKKNVKVNGKTMTLEQAPVITEGNTLIPIRFVTDALGGEVRWDDAERKVTVVRGDKMIELWIGSKELNVNGTRVTAEVPPVIMQDLTMVPLRILSENLGWKVTWDEKNQKITLQ